MDTFRRSGVIILSYLITCKLRGNMKILRWFLLVLLIYGCKDDKPKKPVPKPSPVERPEPPAPTDMTGPKLITKGWKIFRDGEEIKFRGFSIADPWHVVKRNHRENIYAGRKFLLEFLDKGMSLGGNVVRIPLLQRDEWKEGFLDWHQKYTRDILGPLVDHIISKGWYVILDCHYVKDWDKVNRADLYLFWSLMLQRYANHPKVIFEIFNEPIRPDAWRGWVDYIQPTVDQIRQSADNLIIAGGPYWSSHMKGADTLALRGDNISYTAHIYSNQSMVQWSENYPLQHPVFVTEWGFEDGHKEGGDVTWAKNFESIYLRDKSWTMWCWDWEWGPRMCLDKNGTLSDAGRFYKQVVNNG